MSPTGARIVLIEPQGLVRLGLRSALNGRVLTTVVGQAAAITDGVELCRELQPDVAITGLRRRDDRSRHIADIRAVSPHTAIVVATAEDDPSVVLDAMRAGAAAYVLLDGAAEELVVSVDRVLAGETWVDPRLTGALIRSIASSAIGPALPMPAPLTRRELEVLREVARGSANKEIARDLRLAVGTVKVHIERILAKLGAANRAEASMRAIRLGLLDAETVDGGHRAEVQRAAARNTRI